MSKKSDLIIRMMSGVYGLSLSQAEVLADFIIEDRKRILKPLLEWKQWQRTNVAECISETLTLAGMEKA